VRTLAAAYPVQMLCEVVDLPASTYYSGSNKSDELDLRAALEVVAVQHPRSGSRRLTEELKRVGWQINRKRVQRLTGAYAGRDLTSQVVGEQFQCLYSTIRDRPT